jgi:hypothetical protein
VQFGLHTSYPRPGPVRDLPRLTGVHQRLQPLPHLPCLYSLGPFAMCHGFPGLGLLRALRPTPDAVGGRCAFPPNPARPAEPGTGPPGWFPRSPSTDRRVRCPAMPLRHRHDYAVDLHRGLPTGDINQPESSPPRHEGAGAHRNPAHIHRVGAGGFS